MCRKGGSLMCARQGASNETPGPSLRHGSRRPSRALYGFGSGGSARVCPDSEPVRAIRMEPEVRGHWTRSQPRVREGRFHRDRASSLRPEPPERWRPAVPLVMGDGVVVHEALPTGYPATRRTGELACGRNPDERLLHRAKKRRAPCRDQTGNHFRCPWKWSLEPLWKQRKRAVARFLTPSAGLEPATPSLPWQSGRVEQRRAIGENACKDAESVSRQPPAADSMVRHLQLPTGYPGRANGLATQAPRRKRVPARGRLPRSSRAT
jgi:hypothetical protein